MTEAAKCLKLPDIVTKLEQNKWLGDKTGQDSTRKQTAKGETENPYPGSKSFEYKPKIKSQVSPASTPPRRSTKPEGRFKSC